MKKKGAICEFSAERDEAILRTYRRLAHRSASICIREISEQVAVMPCDRFYVSDERALAVVSAMMRGIDATAAMKTSKRRMYEEIHRRVSALRSVYPHVSLISIVSKVVNSPAPELYLSPRYVYDRLTSIINSRRKWKI